MNPELESRIRSLANQFWEDEGRPEGKEAEHWRRASEQLSTSQRGATSEADQGSSSRHGGQRSNRQASGSDGLRGGDPDGAQSGQTKEQAFLRSTTRLTPD